MEDNLLIKEMIIVLGENGTDSSSLAICMPRSPPAHQNYNSRKTGRFVGPNWQLGWMEPCQAWLIHQSPGRSALLGRETPVNTRNITTVLTNKQTPLNSMRCDTRPPPGLLPVQGVATPFISINLREPPTAAVCMPCTVLSNNVDFGKLYSVGIIKINVAVFLCCWAFCGFGLWLFEETCLDGLIACWSVVVVTCRYC